MVMAEVAFVEFWNKSRRKKIISVIEHTRIFMTSGHKHEYHIDLPAYARRPDMQEWVLIQGYASAKRTNPIDPVNYHPKSILVAGRYPDGRHIGEVYPGVLGGPVVVCMEGSMWYTIMSWGICKLLSFREGYHTVGSRNQPRLWHRGNVGWGSVWRPWWRRTGLEGRRDRWNSVD